MRIALLLAAAPLAFAASANAEQAVPRISLETLKSVTETLSSDAFEGRAPTTPAEDKTVALIAEHFQKAGLKPGNNGGWFQDVPLVEIINSNISPITITGGKTPLAFKLHDDMVIATYRVVPDIAIKDSDVVFVGYGINAPERGWNDYAGADVKGKTVVILINDPDWQKPTVGGSFNGRAMTYYGRWTYKFEEAARQGAAAAIIVHDTEPAAYGWKTVDSSWTGPQLGADDAGNHMDQSQAIGWIQKPAAQALFASAGKDFAALAEAARQPGFKAVPLGVKASVSFDNAIKRSMSKNVVGILPGKTRPEEVFLYTAHWDHLGRCTPDETGDDICNGALDNATGTAGLIAVAEAQAKAGPADRSMVFLAVTAEESGLLGSKYYAENPIYPLARTVSGVNMDGLNILGATRDVTAVGAGKSELDPILERAVKAQGRYISPESTPEKGYYYRSDHFSMAKLGVPMFNAGSGDDMVDGGKARGKAIAAEYTDKHYHQASDEYDPRWNWDGAVQDLQLYTTLGRELANATTWPNWNKDDEFRATRDASLAGAGK